MKWGTLLLGVLLVVATGVGACAKLKPTPPPRADVRAGELQLRPGWSLSLGVYQDVTYTLTNSGDADGQATVEITGDYSGVLLTQVINVPAKQTVLQTARVDTNERDNQVAIGITKVITLKR